MANITLAVPKKLHERMRKHPEIKWSEVARHAMSAYVEKLELLDKLTSESRMSAVDSASVAGKVKGSLAERHRALMK
jgi:predicted translin family RNA/ssDNA-binding protein